ncbi:hypothetical protein ACFUTV_41255 [Streptomyces sp. NPDC057298]|uniref:hypothetical protein n=1 Tax=Streptomyces sp. NPDC057298 TaxID=3346091 RepID=UPI0036323F82
MEQEVMVALAAAVISAVAAVVAIWQAGIARTQSQIAVRQTEIMQRQLDAEDAERLDQRRPQFEIEHVSTQEKSGGAAILHFSVKLLSDIPLNSVAVSVYGRSGVAGVTNGYGSPAVSCQIHEMVKGQRREIDVHLVPGRSRTSHVGFRIESTAVGRGKWRSELSVEVTEP